MKLPPRPIAESYWVEPDRFLAGEYPGSYNPEKARRRMDAFLEAGFKDFIDLTGISELVPYDDILKEEALAYGVDVNYTHMPIRDFGIPSRESMAYILDLIDEALAAGRKVFLHCWGGVGRTGTTVGCYLVRHGKTGEEALTQIAEWWQHVPKQDRHPISPETEIQRDFIRNWREIPKSSHQSKQRYCEG